MAITIKGSSLAVTDTRGKQTNVIVTAANKIATSLDFTFAATGETHGAMVVELLNSASVVVDSKAIPITNSVTAHNSMAKFVDIRIGPSTQKLEKMTWEIAQGDINYQDGKLRVSFFGVGGGVDLLVTADANSSVPSGRVDINNGGRTEFEVPFAV